MEKITRCPVSFILVAMFCFVTQAKTQKNAVIGTQIWTSSNLNVSVFVNGDTIPQAKTTQEWMKAIILKEPAWCYYDYNVTNGTKYGKLYNWYAVKDSRGLAPKGWHIPSDEEWNTLFSFLGGESVAGGKLKEAGFAHWTSPNTAADNSSGFTGLPGGYCWNGSLFRDINNKGYWWSSTENRHAENPNLSFDNGNVFKITYSYNGGFSVRCIKD